jgi:Bles03-like protein
MTAALPSVYRRADSTPRRCARRPAASVGPSLAGRFRDGLHVICVYTADCRNVEDLTRVLVRLRVLGFGGLLSTRRTARP